MSMSYSTFPTTTTVEEVILLDLRTGLLDHLVANGLSPREVLKLSANHSLDELAGLVIRETVVGDVMTKAAEDVTIEAEDMMMEAEEDAVATRISARPSLVCQVVSTVPVLLEGTDLREETLMALLSH